MNVRDRIREVLYSIGESIFNVYKPMELVIYIGYAGVALGILISLIPFFVLWWASRKKKNSTITTDKELFLIIALSFLGWGIELFRRRALLFEQVGFLILSATSIFLLFFFGGLAILYLKRKFLKK